MNAVTSKADAQLAMQHARAALDHYHATGDERGLLEYQRLKNMHDVFINGTSAQQTIDSLSAQQNYVNSPSDEFQAVSDAKKALEHYQATGDTRGLLEHNRLMELVEDYRARTQPTEPKSSVDSTTITSVNSHQDELKAMAAAKEALTHYQVTGNKLGLAEHNRLVGLVDDYHARNNPVSIAPADPVVNAPTTPTTAPTPPASAPETPPAEEPATPVVKAPEWTPVGDLSGMSVGQAADALQANLDHNLSKAGGEVGNDFLLRANQVQQKINRLVSMFSNIEKAKHDTAKAVINNMRV